MPDLVRFAQRAGTARRLERARVGVSSRPATAGTATYGAVFCEYLHEPVLTHRSPRTRPSSPPACHLPTA